MSFRRHPRPFSKLLRKLEEESPDESEELSDKDEAKVLEYVATRREAAAQLLSKIFSDRLPADRTFYERLERLRHQTQGTFFVEALLDHLVPHLIARWSEEEPIEVLESLLDLEGTSFFLSLRHLPQLLPKIVPAGEFCGAYFVRVRERIGNDGAQEPFWRTISLWTIRNPSEIRNALNLLQNSRNEYSTSIAACISGTGRSLPAKVRRSIGLLEIETSLAEHPDPKQRLIIHRSWVYTANHRRLTSREFKNAIDRMFSSTDEELDEGFATLSQLLPRGEITEKSLSYGASVLTANAHRATTDIARHFVVGATRAVLRNPVPNSKVRGLLVEAFLAVQPIPEKNEGTWQKIQDLLVGLIERNFNLFIDVFRRLIDANPRGVIHQLSQREA